MKIAMNANLRKIVSLVLAFTALVTLISLMPEHSRYGATADSTQSAAQVLAQK